MLPSGLCLPPRIDSRQHELIGLLWPCQVDELFSLEAWAKNLTGAGAFWHLAVLSFFWANLPFPEHFIKNGESHQRLAGAGAHAVLQHLRCGVLQLVQVSPRHPEARQAGAADCDSEDKVRNQDCPEYVVRRRRTPPQQGEARMLRCLLQDTDGHGLRCDVVQRLRRPIRPIAAAGGDLPGHDLLALLLGAVLRSTDDPDLPRRREQVIVQAIPVPNVPPALRRSVLRRWGTCRPHEGLPGISEHGPGGRCQRSPSLHGRCQSARSLPAFLPHQTQTCASTRRLRRQVSSSESKRSPCKIRKQAKRTARAAMSTFRRYGTRSQVVC